MLYKHIKENPSSYPSSLDGLMKICGITVDWDSIKYYQKFHSFLNKHRKKTMDKMNDLITGGYFERYKNNGISEQDIYQSFIDTCLSYEVIPLWCDVDGKYYLMDLESFCNMINVRFKSIASETVRKFDNLKIAHNILPNKVNQEMSYLNTSDETSKLRNARDKLNKYLPEHSK